MKYTLFMEDIFMNQRRDRIAELINKEGTVSFSRLKAAFPNISEMTLRNDLKALDKDNRIVRVHGGARSIGVIIGADIAYDIRAAQNTAEKRLIAQKALKLLTPGLSIFLDSGSTAIEIARHFPDDSYMIFTSGINCALELTKLTNARAHLIGGELNRYNLSVNGIRSINEIEHLNFNMAFLGTTGFSLERGFTCAVEAENELKRAIIRKADKVVVLMDSRKVGIVNTFTFASPNEISTIISDDKLDEEIKKTLEANGTEVL